jgi:hypothetical protein
MFVQMPLNITLQYIVCRLVIIVVKIANTVMGRLFIGRASNGCVCPILDV